MSRNRWYNVVIFTLFLHVWWLSTIDYSNVYLVSAIPAFLLGMLFNTLLEYSLHRWVFHAEDYMIDSKIVRYMHFMLHGIHHMTPMDP